MSNSKTWEHWPVGKNHIFVDPQERLCPVCDTPLRAVERLFEYEDYAVWLLACTECETTYTIREYYGTITISLQPLDERDERIANLEARVARLEQFVMKTIAQNQVKRPIPTYPHSQERQQEPVDDFMKKYKHILS